jgi:hypothetical protein
LALEAGQAAFDISIDKGGSFIGAGKTGVEAGADFMFFSRWGLMVRAIDPTV